MGGKSRTGHEDLSCLDQASRLIQEIGEPNYGIHGISQCLPGHGCFLFSVDDFFYRQPVKIMVLPFGAFAAEDRPAGPRVVCHHGKDVQVLVVRVTVKDQFEGRIDLIDEGEDVLTVPWALDGSHVLSDPNGQFEFDPHTQKIIELQVMLSIMDF